MSKISRVIVFGNTLALAGIQASIGLDPNCETIACAQETGLQELAALRPDALIFTLDAVPGEFIYALSRELPGLLLIGIDPGQFWSQMQSGVEPMAHCKQPALHGIVPSGEFRRSCRPL